MNRTKEYIILTKTARAFGARCFCVRTVIFFAIVFLNAAVAQMVRAHD